MKVRLQILEGEKILLDTYQSAPNAYRGLHGLLQFEKLDYDPGQFYLRQDWVCYTGYSGNTYRAMSAKNFG